MGTRLGASLLFLIHPLLDNLLYTENRRRVFRLPDQRLGRGLSMVFGMIEIIILLLLLHSPLLAIFLVLLLLLVPTAGGMR
ncbi:MAG: hypothetical protein DYG88_12335 [Chloroflexi bacterium CFX4]|nr:hypothetical protein [Chloroflexi bacterium CFX4]